MTTVVRAIFFENTKYYILSTGFLSWMSVQKLKIVSKEELKKTDNKNRTCHYFDDIIRDFGINFENILLDVKLHKEFRILDKIRYLILFDYSYYDKICDKTKYLTSEKVVLQIVSIIILEESELIHMILYLLKKYWLFIML